MSKYTVREGESLIDVCYNGCGSLGAIYQIMTLNGFDTFTPQLTAGQELEIPETLNNDGVIVANKRPFNSNLLPQATLDKLLEEVAQEEEPIPTMQFTIYVDSTLYDAEYKTDKDSEFTALENGYNEVSIPADFTIMRLGAEDEGTYPVVVVVGERGNYIGEGQSEYAVFERQYYPNVTKLSMLRSTPVVDVSTITMETNGQGDIEYEVTAYPSETIVGSFTDDAGTVELSTIPDDTIALVFYGYDNRADEPHTPTVYSGLYKGQDGYTTLLGEDIYAIAGETITITIE